MTELEALQKGPHHQGGHSSTGRKIARVLNVPFPLTMPNLAKRAIQLSQNPTELWPWSRDARAAYEAAKEGGK